MSHFGKLLAFLIGIDVSFPAFPFAAVVGPAGVVSRIFFVHTGRILFQKKMMSGEGLSR